MFVSIRQAEVKMYEKTFLKVKNIIMITQKRRHTFSFLCFHVGKREIIYISRKGSKIEHTFCATR